MPELPCFLIHICNNTVSNNDNKILGFLWGVYYYQRMTMLLPCPIFDDFGGSG